MRSLVAALAAVGSMALASSAVADETLTLGAGKGEDVTAKTQFGPGGPYTFVVSGTAKFVSRPGDTESYDAFYVYECTDATAGDVWTCPDTPDPQPRVGSSYGALKELNGGRYPAYNSSHTYTLTTSFASGPFGITFSSGYSEAATGEFTIAISGSASSGGGQSGGEGGTGGAEEGEGEEAGGSGEGEEPSGEGEEPSGAGGGEESTGSGEGGTAGSGATGGGDGGSSPLIPVLAGAALAALIAAGVVRVVRKRRRPVGFPLRTIRGPFGPFGPFGGLSANSSTWEALVVAKAPRSAKGAPLILPSGKIIEASLPWWLEPQSEEARRRKRTLTR